jgi:preprotein translocase subunit SecD
MNRYPFWKYAVIAVALVVGILYTVPNFFPDVPGGAGVLGQGEGRHRRARTGRGSAEAANIPYRGATLDATGVKVRLPDPDTQIKTRDVLQAKLGENYIVALNLLSSSPHWLASIGALPMYLGLDLRGGVHFLLQVDMKAALDKKQDSYAADVRSLLRKEKDPVRRHLARRRQCRLPIPRRRRAHQGARLIERTFPDLQFRETDAGAGELRLMASLKPRR